MHTDPVTEFTARSDLVLVFERDGFVYAYQSVADAAQSIESIDVMDGRYLGAFSNSGEVIDLEGDPGELFATLTPTGNQAHAKLAELIRQSRGPQDLAGDPHAFALAVLAHDGAH
jgi:hypothetical protein